MSGLFASLNNTVQAMSAQSRAIEITGKNMANVDNPNYSRESILLGSRGTLQTPQGPESMGVAALGLQQMRDSLLDQQVVSQVALTAGYTTQQQAYQRAQAALGQSVGGAQSTSGASSVSSGGLGASMDDFFNAFQSLAARPTDPGQRQVLLQNASILTDRLHQTNQSLARVSADLTTQVGTDVTTVNGLLQAVADLSKQIARLEINNPGSAVDLRDQRQTDIEQLAAKLPVSTQTTATGQFQVYAKDSLGNQVILVDGANVPGPVAVTGSQVTGGSGATALTLSGGSIQGAISARDGAIKTLSDNLDQLAAQLVAAVNKAYNPTGTTGDFSPPRAPRPPPSRWRVASMPRP